MYEKRRFNNISFKIRKSTTDSHYDNKISDTRRIINRLRDILPKNIERKLKISFMKQNIKEIFQKKKEKETINTLENQ